MPRTLSSYIFLVFVALMLVPASVRAEPIDPDDVPESLRAWIPWVTHDQPQAGCPFLQGETSARRCEWPSELALELTGKGGKFSQTWRVYRPTWVPLPGDDRRWPQEVTIDGAAVVVLNRGGMPGVELTPGSHTLAGRFLWDALPEKLRVPAATGLLRVQVDGAPVAAPQRDDDGTLWLNRTRDEGTEADHLDLVVHRRVNDGLPLQVVTRVELHASGKNREELLGKTLLPGFVAMAVDSQVPARIEPDGKLRVQLRPGRWVVDITARHEGPVESLQPGEPGGPWAEEEVWVFAADPRLHQVDITGVASVDPQQTLLPDEWKSLPAYRLRAGEAMVLTERRRGEVDRGPDRLQLQRDWWLDFDGREVTVHDRIHGQVHSGWRLDMQPRGTLGHVNISGKDQFITYREGSPQAGVELRSRELNLSADLRVPGHDGNGVLRMSAVDWDHDFHEVSGNLHLPPGWRLLHAEGIDEVRNTWVQSWTLLDIFLVLVISIAIGRLYGWAWGLLSLLSLGLCFPEWGAPRLVWIFVLVGEALNRALPEGKLRLVVRAYRGVVLITLAGLVLGFVVQQVRQGLYPALERHGSDSFVLGAMAPGADMAVQKVANTEFAAMEPEPLAEDEEYRDELKKDEADGDGWVEQQQADDKPVDIANLDTSSSITRGRTKNKKGGSYKAMQRQLQRKKLREYDANTVVQTGPGIPGWQWKSIPVRWQGPVDRTHEVVLYMAPPRLNTAMAFVRVLFMITLGLAVLGVFRAGRRKRPPQAGAKSGAAAAIALILAFFGTALVPGTARADFPSPELLETLRARVQANPTCLPNCAQSPRMRINVTPESLQLQLELHVASETGVPLPGSASQWLPTSVVVDGAQVEPEVAPGEPSESTPAAKRALARDAEGRLWVQLSPGRHRVVLRGPLPSRETVQLAMPLKPHYIEAQAAGWTIEGIHEDGLADDNLQLTKIHREGDAKQTLEMGPLPAFVRVERSLQLGLSWEVNTRVERMTPPGSAVVLAIPLLPSESVTTDEMRVEDGKVLVNMGPDAREIEWTSVLEVSPSIALVAAENQPWVEVWRLEVGPLWHVEAEGIPVVENGDQGLRVWQPWPGEQVALAVTRPEGVPGQTLTVDRVHLSLNPGRRATDATLTMQLRSSRGGHHTLTLPAEASLQTVRINGSEKSIGQDGQEVRIPVVPGSQSVQLDWREPHQLRPRYTAPVVDLGTAAVNVETTIEFPRDRWVLWVRGPLLGPAVLFWSYIVMVILAALILGQVRRVQTPLRTHHWFLLGIGLSPLPVPAAMVVVLWFLALGWRRSNTGLSPAWFNLRQLALAGWTIAAIGCLIGAIHAGLLLQPDMQVEGNGSYDRHLVWFQDRVQGKLARPTVYSVPILWYRGLMLVWALWLAWALVKWLPWVWQSFSGGSLWKPFNFNPPFNPRPNNDGPRSNPRSGMPYQPGASGSGESPGLTLGDGPSLAERNRGESPLGKLTRSLSGMSGPIKPMTTGEPDGEEYEGEIEEVDRPKRSWSPPPPPPGAVIPTRLTTEDSQDQSDRSE